LATGAVDHDRAAAEPADPAQRERDRRGTNEGRGALMIAETSTGPPKCATVGVPKALIDSAVVRMRRCAMSATTTNWDERLESSECSQGAEDEPARARHDSQPHFF
jgi:hypothetical protein